ncbi:hypothetical protein F4813DRAFT_364165 [Daldinia decipiens]|uniref:uncharacterized protein n=1 Tax=Daldinia decipiens TaxID=326647 RepID=UPI0020C23F0F|nr:uncharacterized protein F4813DRAFT_364165 [Daldinia decipiens]KAI1656374.1 hypothetical protein F4813DRAFT_364165 [Daldinia decipiens]
MRVRQIRAILYIRANVVPHNQREVWMANQVRASARYHIPLLLSVDHTKAFKNYSIDILRIELRYIPQHFLLWFWPPTNELALQGLERLLTSQEHMDDPLSLWPKPLDGGFRRIPLRPGGESCTPHAPQGVAHLYRDKGG